MKTILLWSLTFLPFFISAQTFSEICINQNTNGTVVSMTSFQDTIYATGFFTQICGQPAGHIAKWVNGSWEPTPWSISDPGHAFEVIDNKLYVARYEESIDSNWVYTYDGDILEKMGPGIYLTTATGFSMLPNIYDIIEFQGQIYACGEFDRVGTQSISGIMRWNGNSWEDVGGGLSSNISTSAPVIFPHQMMVFDGALYVCGNFRFAGGLEVNGIAKWNGTDWSALGDGFNSTVYGLGVFQNELYAGGSFTQSGATPLLSIAKWDGTQWVSPGFGFESPSVNDFTFVHTFYTSGSTLYIGGGLKQITYDNASTNSCGGIVRFDGDTLETFQGGVPGVDIEAILVTPDQEVLIGGGVFGNGYLGILDLSTAVQSPTHAGDPIQLSPNPFTTHFSVQTSEKILSLALFNASGQKVFEVQNPSYQPFFFPNLTPGWYTVKIDTPEGSRVQSIVKK